MTTKLRHTIIGDYGTHGMQVMCPLEEQTATSENDMEPSL